MPKDWSLYRVGDREADQRLDQKLVEANLRRYGRQLCPGSEEGREQVVVDEFLAAALVKSTVAQQGKVPLETKGRNSRGRFRAFGLWVLSKRHELGKTISR